MRAAADINTTANAIYRHNHPDIKLLSNNIQKFKAKDLLKLDVNTILMSPPCQPFTRVGNKKDVADARSNALVHICEMLPDLHSIQYILMENVKGFEISQARDLYIDALQRAGFELQEFLLSPTEIGVPNSRLRYYCLARKSKPFTFKTETILERLPSTVNESKKCKTIEEALKDVEPPKDVDYTPFLLSDDILLKRLRVLDIKYPSSRTTNCFTKAYTHYAEGTGSIFCPVDEKQANTVFDEIKKSTLSSEGQLIKLKSLKMRYFTPQEVAKLMSFPSEFTFPDETTAKQRYRVLGNSINVAIVGKLIEFLVNDNKES